MPRETGGFVRLYAEQYLQAGISKESVDILINHAIFPGNLRIIDNKQIRALPGFKEEDISKLEALRQK